MIRSRLYRCRTRRGGSVALMIVLVLTLLVGTFAASVSSRVTHERRSEQHRQIVAVLQSAIDSVAASQWDGEEEIRLPLDEDSWRWIVVEKVSQAGAAAEYQATLYHQQKPGLFIRRLFATAPSERP